MHRWLIVLGLGLGTVLPARAADIVQTTPVIQSLGNGTESGLGLIWLTLNLSDKQADKVKLTQADVAFRSSGNTSLPVYQSFLDATLSALAIQTSTSVNSYRFVWTVPEGLLALDLADIDFKVSVSDNTGISNVIEHTLKRVNIVTAREIGWTRQSVVPATAFTFTPGNYAIFKYYGAGATARMGEAINMGKVDVILDGIAVAGSPFNNYPSDVPAGATPTVVSDTRFPKRRLFTLSTNTDHVLKIRLAVEKSPRATANGLALTTLSYDWHPPQGGGVLTQIRDLPVDDANVKLYGVPPAFSTAAFGSVTKAAQKAVPGERSKVSRSAAKLPAGAGAWRVEHGPYAGPTRRSTVLSPDELDFSDLRTDQPYAVDVRALSDLGMESEHRVRGMLFRLSQPTFSAGRPVELSVGSLEIPAAAEVAVMSNGGRIPEFRPDATLVAIQSLGELEGVESGMTLSPGLAGVAVYSYRPLAGGWVLVQPDANSRLALGKTSAVLVESTAGTDATPAESGSGGGGGGCWLR